MRYLDKFTNLSQHDYQTGQVAVDEEPCTGCRKCTLVCPSSALEMFVNGDGAKKARMIPNANCISCSACYAICLPKAIEVTRFWRVPSGAYQTLGRIQPVGNEALPRVFAARVKP